MIHVRLLILMLICVTTKTVFAQQIIPLDTAHWDIQAKAYLVEHHQGKNAIYLQNGAILLKEANFLNGTIEFDIFLKEGRMYPGVIFRGRNNFQDGEQWFIRAHLSGLEDANQAAPVIKGITPWQLYFGPKYSFAYTYNYNGWTHVKVVVNDNKAQVFLDHSEKPNLSWNLFHEPVAGDLMIRTGTEAMYIADVIVDKKATTLVDFKPIENEKIEGLIQEWEISDMFERTLLEDPEKIPTVIQKRSWGRKIQLEEGKAANIGRQQLLFNGEPGETVFAKIEFVSDKNQTKLFHFGYSDDVVAILNGTPIYKGTNKWRTRDYRYLGTIGLFDGIYLNLKKGKNTLLMAVSENFGGWLITGKFEDEAGVQME